MKKLARNSALLLVISMISLLCCKAVLCSEVTKNRTVYLTFDDGPSYNNTDAILDILAKNNVRATFCVVGKNVVANKGTMKRLNRLKMGIIPHCNNHMYNEIYSSSNNYINDLEKCIEAINSTINEDRGYDMVRMPGGSSNHVCKNDVMNDIKSRLRNEDLYYIDWTIDSGDTHAPIVDARIIKNNIINYAGRNSVEVVLMHDLENKVTTTESLQEIIDTYKKLGYEFKTVEEMEGWEKQVLIKQGILNRK